MSFIKKISHLFMAFSKGKMSTDGVSFPVYTGLGSVGVMTINPDRNKYNEIIGSTGTDPIVYVKDMTINDKKYPSVRISILTKVFPEANNGISAIIPISFFLVKMFEMNKDGSKVKVMDEYGRTAWVTKDELKTHAIPVYKNGPARISNNYRPIYRGEENITMFLKAFTCVEDIDFYNSNTSMWEENKNKDNCLCRLDKVADYFKGDISEFVGYVNDHPENKLKILFGVRHSDDNKTYQDFYNRSFMRNSQTSLKRLTDEVKKAQEAKSYPNTTFTFATLTEFKEEIKPTNLNVAHPASNIQEAADDVFSNAQPATTSTGNAGEDTGEDMPADTEADPWN